MKQIKVTVLDKHTLRLEEDANKYDQIDLANLTSVDFEFIQKAINEKRDEVYAQRLKDFERTLNAEKNIELQSLKSELKSTNEKNAAMLESQKQLDKQVYEKQLSEIQNQLAVKDKDKLLEIQQLNLTAQEKYNLLKNEIDLLKSQKENEISLKINEIEKIYKDKLSKAETELQVVKKQNEIDSTKAVMDCKESYDKIINEKNEAIYVLQNQKIITNIKMIGEGLEKFCEEEMRAYMQNGFQTCTWDKDNKTVKNAEDEHGSKADYLFRVYPNEAHNEAELLASVCLDMKDENPNTKDKKTNKYYYKDLDNNRKKKNCKYAVLVSNLETNNLSLPVIYKVSEYEDMYVVRPGYMIVFLNMIVSLSLKYSKLLLQKAKEDIELKSKTDIIAEFESIKLTYLDKPLQTLKNQIKIIVNQATGIISAAEKISEACETITGSYIEVITTKLETYQPKLHNKVLKKLD